MRFQLAVALISCWGLAPAELSLEPADRLKIYALETELYHERLRAEKKILLKRLIAREAAKAGITPDEWEKKFAAQNIPELDEKKLRALLGKGNESDFENARKVFLYEYDSALREQLWQDLSHRYGARLSAKRPSVPEILLETQGFLSHGNSAAAIEIVEFFDLDCHYCQQASAEYARLRKEFSHKVRWVSIDFPAEGSHPRALNAHIALHCAEEQKRYFEYKESLFGLKDDKGEERILKAAREISLDADVFEKCRRIRRETITSEIHRGVEYGKRLGIPGTPTLFIKGRPYPGFRPYKQLKLILRELSP